MTSVKQLVLSSGNIRRIPSNYICIQPADSSVVPPSDSDSDVDSIAADSIPIIDFSLLTSGTLEQQSDIVRQLGHACLEWGFFLVTNHSLSKKLMDDMVEVSAEFFELKEDEKNEYRGNHLFDPIKYGTSFNVNTDEHLFWRDHLKVFVHPQFHAPSKPPHFRDISKEFCRKTKEVAKELLEAICVSLGLDKTCLEKSLSFDSGSQLLVVNCYPPCPQPELAMGLPPHSDHGLLTILISNQLAGLEILHRSKWIPINPKNQESLIINIGDQMEIFSNGVYKSVIHRAVVNNKATRISIGIANGPPLEKVVTPATELVDENTRAPAYRGITYKEYLEIQSSNQLNANSCLDYVRI